MMTCYALILDDGAELSFLPVMTDEADAIAQLKDTAGGEGGVRLVELRASDAGWTQRHVASVVDGEFHLPHNGGGWE